MRRFTTIFAFLLSSAAIFFLLFLTLNALFPLPPLKPYSLVVQDRHGAFLHAFLAEDGMWRLQTRSGEIPKRLKDVLIKKEDRFFYYHPGVNPVSVCRAFLQNVLAGRRVSGASTLTMQVARMLERKERTYSNKVIEMFRAFQLEWRYSKDQILDLYLSIVPLGGNIEGLESASLFYYQTPLERLNIAQLFDLILIPNDPNHLRPDKNASDLFMERKRQSAQWIKRGLLSRLDSIVIWEMRSEAKRKPLSMVAPHFCWRIKEQANTSAAVRTSLDLATQTTAEMLLRNHVRPWKKQGVQNSAVIVIDNSTMEVIAYIGSPDFTDSSTQGQVDAIRALRSPGSALKPFLCALEMERGTLTPKTRLLDVPYDDEGFTAENYDGKFSGFVYADEALRRSLNVPFVRLLRRTGAPRFLQFMEDVGVASLKAQKEKLGLSVILGGCGVTLEELTAAYATFAHEGMYREPTFIKASRNDRNERRRAFSPSTAFLVTEILSGMDRPDLPNNFASSLNLPRVAFKTGTSYGRRDAWCLGYSSEFTIGVWVGNVTNTGIPDLVASKSAAPLLIDLFNSISTANRKTILRTPPDIDVRSVCATSGKLPTAYCKDLVQDIYSVTQTQNLYCDIHKEYLVSRDGKKHYCPNCLGDNPYGVQVCLEFPPELLAYWKKAGIPFKLAPPHNPACDRLFAGEGPKIASPSKDMTYYLTEEGQQILFQASSGVEVSEHRWYIDERFIGRKRAGARLFMSLKEGTHTITCLDDKGRMTSVKVTVHIML
ncbi:MAG: penicillin-binding protein 1C [Ignavibacteriales bacterium]|nr:penicillin-binding protein 1C [Ignavibacteriales bacterium]